jgi:hypothetical protein
MKMRRISILALLCLPMLVAASCDDSKSSDQQQQAQQETLLQEATNQVGMPNIKNFRERKLLKDQDGLVTYTYLFSEMTGKWVYLGQSIGYGIPYATQFTNPSKIEYNSTANRQGFTYQVLPQADPNGLFSPAAAEGTWVLLKNPASNDVKPVYIEPRVIVSPFPLPQQ